MESNAPSPNLWQQTKSFFGSGFWGGLIKGALIGIPISIIAAGIFSALPDALFAQGAPFFIMEPFRDVSIQLLFNTVLGAASGSINGGIQAVSALREPTMTPPQPALNSPLPSTEISLMRDEPIPAMSRTIQAILERGPKGSATQSLFIESSETTSQQRLH